MNKRLWLAAKEAAVMLDIHVNTLKRLPPSDLPFMRIASRGDRRYRPEDVEAYIERHTVRA